MIKNQIVLAKKHMQENVCFKG